LDIADFYLFGRLKQQLYGRILDSDQNVPETITEIPKELPTDGMKNAFCTGRENVSGD
jgi:hypothetical protein